MEEKPTNEQVMIAELQARIGQLVSSYETQIVQLRIEASRAIESLSAKIVELSEPVAPEASPSVKE